MIEFIAQYKDENNSALEFSAFHNTKTNTVKIFRQDVTSFLIFCDFPYTPKNKFDKLFDFHDFIDGYVTEHSANILMS